METKEDQSPVTIADREAEQYLRKRITEAFPEDGILGEEFGKTDGTGRAGPDQPLFNSYGRGGRTDT